MSSVAALVDRLAVRPFSDRSDAVSRHAWTAGFQATVEEVSGEARAAGLRPRLDPVGTLVADPAGGGRAVGIGSHLDAVRRGGAWDGVLGVSTALAVARTRPGCVRVVAWIEEEGAGFGQMLLGSRVATGRVGLDALARDIRSVDDGRPFLDHALGVGLRPHACADAARTLDGMIAWIEPHIEQGAVLESAGEAIGIVEAIAGYIHADLELTGHAGHAGTTPMALRADALTGAAAVALAIEDVARRSAGALVATVGELTPEPGAINVVAGQARLSVDIRGRRDASVQAAMDEILGTARRIASSRGLRLGFTERGRQPAVGLDPHLVEVLLRASRSEGVEARVMVSGAAHDAMTLASHVPSAMVFIACRGGVSHDPAERAEPSHADLAARIVARAVDEIKGER